MSRLTDSRRSELFQGMLELVSERGYDKVTMDQIAEHTHSSKATLYRQWGSKARLFVDALASYNVAADVPNTGTLPGDLYAFLSKDKACEVDSLPPELPSDLLASLLSAAKGDPELASAVRDDLVAPFARTLQVMFDRAVERGEVRPSDVAVDHAVLAFLAPFLLVPALYDDTIDHDWMVRYVDTAVLPALGVR